MPRLSPDGSAPVPRDALIALDANALEPGGLDRDSLIGRCRDLMRTGALRIVPLDGVGRELGHPHTPPDARPPSTVPARPRRAPTAAEHIARIRVRAIMRGDAQNSRHDADAAHLCEAAEAGCQVFLTHDKRFARKRADLEAALPGLRIMGLREFFALYGREADQAE